MTDISKLKGITLEEINKLSSKKIKTIDDLWFCIGKDFDKGIHRIAELTGIEQDRLINLLADQAVHEAKQEGGRWGRVKQHWLDIGVIAGLLLLSLLGVRVFFNLTWQLPSLGFRDTVVVAANNLKSGHVLRSDELYNVWLIFGGHFTATAELDGMILARDLPTGKPLRFEDVLRSQVVAASDITSGTIISYAMITTTWSVYQPEAAIQINEVVGHRAQQNIQAGKVILSEFIDPDLMMLKQVVVSTTTGLPAFHLINKNDVMLKETPKEPGAFVSVDEVVERYSLQAIPHDTILRADQLSPTRLSPTDLTGRQIVSIPVGRGTFSLTLTPGTEVSLLFSPRFRSKINNSQLIVKDVILLAVEQDSDTRSIVVAVKSDDLEDLITLLGVSDMFVSQSVP